MDSPEKLGGDIAFHSGVTSVEDRYARQPIVSSLYNVVIRGVHDVPLIIGLEGSWGSGKSWVLDELKSTCRRNQDDVEFINLSPVLWGTPISLLPTWVRLISDRLYGWFKRKFRGWEVIEAAQAISTMVSYKVGDTGISFRDYGQAKYTDPEYLRRTVRTWLAGAVKKKTVVLVLDDLDRAPREALSSALRLILFLFLNEPSLKNLKLILAYDRSVIEHLLAGELGRDFIEKFAHVVIPLPTVPSAEKSSELLRKLRAIPEFERQWAELKPDVIRLFSHQIGLAATVLRHPRDIDNVANIIRAVASRAHEELFLPDLVSLLAIQTSCPELYRSIERYPEPLYEHAAQCQAFWNAPFSDKKIEEPQRAHFRKWIRERYSFPENRTDLIEVVMAMSESRNHFTDGVLRRLANDRAFHDAVSIRKYFRLGPSPDHLSRKEIDQIMTVLPTNTDILARTFEKEHPAGRWLDFMEKMTEKNAPKLREHPVAVEHLLKAVSKAFDCVGGSEEDALRNFAARLYHILAPATAAGILKSGVRFGCSIVRFYQKYVAHHFWHVPGRRDVPRPTDDERTLVLDELKRLGKNRKLEDLDDSDIFFLLDTFGRNGAGEIVILLDEGDRLGDRETDLFSQKDSVRSMDEGQRALVRKASATRPILASLISKCGWPEPPVLNANDQPGKPSGAKSESA